MVSKENRTGLYISIPLYFVLLFCVAYWGYIRTKYLKTKSDELSAHYLGGRSFGPLLSAGTMFASQFSGYTIVGIPNEAYKTGWVSLRWILTGISVIFGYAGTAYRLRKCSLLRNHQSPVDFITDRFRSQILRYTTLLLQALASLIYLSAQVTATKVLFNSIFELDPDSVWGVCVIFFLILLFEWTGGLVSVAATDGIQGIVMVLGFILIPIIVATNFGGWKDLDPLTYPRPDFYQTPTKETQWLMWNFAASGFGFFSLPHMIQRTYAAKNLESIRWAYWSVAFGGLLSWLPVIFLGTMAVQILHDSGIKNPPSAFASIMEEIMDLGWFGKLVGVISFTSGLAAIMSTADSILIAISQMLTVEIVYPMIPDATPHKITWIGRGVSLVTLCVSLLIGIFWDEGLSDLAKIQFGISLQCVPAFLNGLFGTKVTECHPWSLAVGSLAGLIMTISLYFGYVKNNPTAFKMDTGVMACLVNCVIVLIIELIRRVFTGTMYGAVNPHPSHPSLVSKEKSLPPVKEFNDDDDDDSSAEEQAETAVVANDDTVPEKKMSISAHVEFANMDGIDTRTRVSILAITEEADQFCSFSKRPVWDLPRMERFGDYPLTQTIIWNAMEGTWEPFTNAALVFLIFFMTTITIPIGPGAIPPLNADGTFGYLPATIRGIPYWAFLMIIMSVIAFTVLIVVIYFLPLKYGDTVLDPETIELLPKEMDKRTTYDEANNSARKRRSSIRDSISNILEKEKRIIDDQNRRRISELMSSEFSF